MTAAFVALCAGCASDLGTTVRPFRVLRCRTGGWDLCRTSGEARFVGCFPTQGEAIDFAYKTWPWYL